LQKLGEALLTLRGDLYERLALPRIASDGTRRTQADHELRRAASPVAVRGQAHAATRAADTLQSVRDALEEQRSGSAQQTLALHAAEKWRDDLIASDDAVQSWIAAHPATDSQQLRALVRRRARTAHRPRMRSRRARRRAAAAPSARSSSWCATRWTRKNMSDHDPVTIGIVSVSDRASSGVYEDKGLPALKDWLGRALKNPITFAERLIPDEKERISATLIELVDAGCSLVLTTGGTGPAPRDVTPEATLAVADKEMPGFGEQMRQISLRFVPTAILSRQVAVVRKQSLVINLPGQPKSIQETLEGLKEDGKQVVPGIFAAVPYCVDLIGGPYLETNDAVCKGFRPKSAIRAPK
jgi:molybdopterin adenylyltransferase